MKKLALVILALGSANAFAVDSNSSWNEIYAAGLTAQFPQVNFGIPESGNAVFLGVDGVCVDGDQMKSINPVTVCVEYASRGEEYVCMKEESRILSTARSFTKTAPGGDGLPDMEYEFTYALDYQIPVGRELGEGGFRELFTKAFTIPACNR